MKENKLFEPNQWIYTMPDGTEETNMLDARRQLKVSKVRFIGMLKSGYVTRRKRQ